MRTVTRTDLARMLAEDLGIKKDLARQAVDAMVEGLVEAIVQGNRIEIRGFGIWTVKETHSRPNARNPRTGERVFVPARRKVRFNPGKVLKEVLSRPS